MLVLFSHYWLQWNKHTYIQPSWPAATRWGRLAS